MLQYKKASLLPEIGWNFASKPIRLLNNSQENQDDKISQKSSSNESFFLSKSALATGTNLTNKLKSDTRIVPLLLCHLFNYSQQQTSTQQNDLKDPCIITLFSPDLKRSLVLRCNDVISAETWANAISSEIHETTLNAIAEANLNLSSILKSTIKYMGWLSEKIDNLNYRPTFLVLTSKELLFFDKVPYTIENWDPVLRYSLEHCRLVKGSIDATEQTTNQLNGSNGNFKDQNKLNNNSNSFALRIGTLDGIITVQLSSNSYQSLLIWAKNIFESSCNAAIALKEVSFCKFISSSLFS